MEKKANERSNCREEKEEMARKAIVFTAPDVNVCRQRQKSEKLGQPSARTSHPTGGEASRKTKQIQEKENLATKQERNKKERGKYQLTLLAESWGGRRST